MAVLNVAAVADVLSNSAAALVVPVAVAVPRFGPVASRRGAGRSSPLVSYGGAALGLVP